MEKRVDIPDSSADAPTHAGTEHRRPSEIRFPDDLWAQVGHHAVDQRVSRAEIVRRAVRTYLRLVQLGREQGVGVKELLARLDRPG